MKLDGYEWQSDFAIKHRAEGRAIAEAKGMAQALLGFLPALGIYVSDDARERITGCTDQKQLELWIERAAKAQNVDELFG